MEAQQPGQSHNAGAGHSVFRTLSTVLKRCPYCLDMFRCMNFAAHLVDCRNRNPKNLVEFVICPHDYSHHVRVADMKDHLDVCEARANVILQEIKGGYGHPDDQIRELKEQLNSLQPELERRKKKAFNEEKNLE